MTASMDFCASERTEADCKGIIMQQSNMNRADRLGMFPKCWSDCPNAHKLEFGGEVDRYKTDACDNPKGWCPIIKEMESSGCNSDCADQKGTGGDYVNKMWAAEKEYCAQESPKSKAELEDAGEECPALFKENDPNPEEQTQNAFMKCLRAAPAMMQFAQRYLQGSQSMRGWEKYACPAFVQASKPSAQGMCSDLFAPPIMNFLKC